MRQRCSNPKYYAYARYGGRGIQVCDRWRNSNRRCAILNALCNNQEIAIADPATSLFALHGVAHALAAAVGSPRTPRRGLLMRS